VVNDGIDGANKKESEIKESVIDTKGNSISLDDESGAVSNAKIIRSKLPAKSNFASGLFPVRAERQSISHPSALYLKNPSDRMGSPVNGRRNDFGDKIGKLCKIF
jgi:hypothetical protein